jgi:hypothetical protein
MSLWQGLNYVATLNRRKTLYIKIKGNENTSRHNPKKEQKQTINKDQIKTLCKEDSWLRMTIVNNKEDLK